MRLFDDIERTERRPSGYAESEYEYLNLSARPGEVEIRTHLESWFAHYPAEGQNEFATAFRSSRDT